MIPAAQALIAELDAETPATRRVLERIPGDRLAWRPHAKSMSLGQLALHTASIPGRLTQLAMLDGFDAASASFEPAQAESAAALLAELEASVATARELLAGLDETRAFQPWSLSHGARTIFTQPRIGVIRTLAFNHWYHHRGQLQIYLRLLDVPVPVVYGRSADENPFAAAN